MSRIFLNNIQQKMTHPVASRTRNSRRANVHPTSNQFDTRKTVEIPEPILTAFLTEEWKDFNNLMRNIDEEEKIVKVLEALTDHAVTEKNFLVLKECLNHSEEMLACEVWGYSASNKFPYILINLENILNNPIVQTSPNYYSTIHGLLAEKMPIDFLPGFCSIPLITHAIETSDSKLLLLLLNRGVLSSLPSLRHKYPDLLPDFTGISQSIIELILIQESWSFKVPEIQFLVATIESDTRKITGLLKKGVDVNCIPDKDSLICKEMSEELGPPLFYAARKRDLKGLKFLVGRGADVRMIDRRGRDVFEWSRCDDGGAWEELVGFMRGDGEMEDRGEHGESVEAIEEM